MDPRENLLRIYRELADWYERQRQPQMRDRFLVLAADAALLAGKNDEAERLRVRLLKVNPHHMLKPYPSFAQALKAPDVLTYVKDLRVNYPADVAEDLLRTLQADEKRPPAAGEAALPLPPAPVAEHELFFDDKPPEPDLAPTAPAPRAHAAANPPQTIPLQEPMPTRPLPVRAAPPRAEPVRPRRPLPAPLAVEPAVAPPHPAAEPAARTSWMAVLLFLLVLATGAALAAFTFLRPYLPPEWLPR